MNYLAHTFLSFGDPDLVTGNMIADHVKGRLALERFPERIREGIVLHRKIDEFADQHPACKRACIYFRKDYGLYAGAIVDSLNDHFLANDARSFSSEAALAAFSQKTYAQLETNAQYFPEKFAAYFPYMKQYDWLTNYRNLGGIRKSLEGLQRRAMYMPDPAQAYQIFIGNYYLLEQCYYEVFDGLTRFVRTAV